MLRHAIRGLIGALVVLPAVCFFAPEADAQSYWVTGYVRDKGTNLAAPYAFVRIRWYANGTYSQNTYTADSTGYYRAGWSSCPGCSGGNMELWACSDKRSGIVTYTGSTSGTDTKNILISNQNTSTIIINEWVSNDVGADDWEFVELAGPPGASLDGLSLLLIEGEEGGGKGTVDEIVDLTGYVIEPSGFFVIGDPHVLPQVMMAPGFIENGGNNILLVEGCTVAIGEDIDLDDDGVEDMPVGAAVLDGVGYGYPETDAITYCGAWPVGPDYTWPPAAGAICLSNWCVMVRMWSTLCLAGTEPGGMCEWTGYDVQFATPGAPNACSPGAVSVQEGALEQSTWGRIKGMYR